MLPAERKREIVETVDAEDGCAVSELAERLDVSKATIRRDLADLEGEGLVERSHGGALPVRTVASELSYGHKGVKNLEEKRTIAERAVKEIHEGQAIFFDAGTTTMELAKRAPKDGSYIAATNSPLLALEIAEDGGEVKLTGGTLRQQTRALVGPTGESFLRRTNFDQLFLGTNALDPEAGLTTPNEEEARMKRLMCENAQRVVLVSDHTKLGRRSFVQFAALDQIDLFVTDREVPVDIREALEAADVDVVDGVAE